MKGDETVKLQMALDDISLDAGVALVRRVRDCVDVVEVGTPMVMEYGMEAVRRVRQAAPGLGILADLKIMDAGAYEAELALRAGADLITVLGVTDDRTICGCVEAAKRHGGRVVVDMICVEDVEARIAQLEAMGVDFVSVHVGVDQQAAGQTPLDALRRMSACVKTAKISVAGGITVDTLPDYLACRPEIVIVGGGIVHAPDPEAAARQFHAVLLSANDDGNRGYGNDRQE